MKSPDPLFSAVEAFFVDHLKLARGCSSCTLRSYRDTLRLLFEFAGRVRSLSVDRLRLVDFDADLILAFLNHLEKEPDHFPRCQSTVTRWTGPSSSGGVPLSFFIHRV